MANYSGSFSNGEKDTPITATEDEAERGQATPAAKKGTGLSALEKKGTGFPIPGVKKRMCDGNCQ